MAVWKSAVEIEATYFVSAGRLEAYGRRGNLSFRRDESGNVLYEESAVARLFRSRDGRFAPAAGATERPSLGLLGAVRLGQPAAPLRVSRGDVVRARAFQAGREIVERARKAG